MLPFEGSAHTTCFEKYIVGEAHHNIHDAPGKPGHEESLGGASEQGGPSK
jgi:hypothetical protein